jgi:rare lipoprotein A
MVVMCKRWPIGLIVVVLLGGCSSLWQPSPSVVTAPQPAPSPPISNVPRTVQTGIASWYGPGFHGKRTSNGEVYNQYDMTAAHPTLPLGSRVMVTNVQTNQSVEVRINDRGPFVGGRVIDLSYAAARTIGLYEPGTAAVRIEVLLAAAPTLAVLYAVQVGSYADADKAAALKARVIRHYPDVYISPMSTGLLRYYQVRLGPFARRNEAVTRGQEVAQAGLQALIVEEDDRWAER